MARQLFDQDIRDTSSHASGDLAVDDETGVFQLVSTLDQDADYTIEGTHDADDDWSDAVELSTGTTTAGSTESAVLSDPWDKVRATVQCSTAPTSGSYTVLFHDED